MGSMLATVVDSLTVSIHCHKSFFFYLFVLDTPEDILESLCKSAEKRWQIKIK